MVWIEAGPSCAWMYFASEVPLRTSPYRGRHPVRAPSPARADAAPIDSRAGRPRALTDAADPVYAPPMSDELFRRLFGDSEPTHLGSGWASGVGSVFLVALGLGAVLCLH